MTVTVIQTRRRRRNKIFSLETPLTIPTNSMMSGEEGELRIALRGQI